MSRWEERFRGEEDVVDEIIFNPTQTLPFEKKGRAYYF